MHVAIQFSSQEELKALPILLRHSPGRILPGRHYVVSVAAARALCKAGINFRKIEVERRGGRSEEAVPQSTKGHQK
jgi:hypothetical protein